MMTSQRAVTPVNSFASLEKNPGRGTKARGIRSVEAETEGSATKFPKPSWNTEPRRGKINDAQFAALLKKRQEPWLAALLSIYFHYGFRKQELLTMKIRQVNTSAVTLTLAVADTKTKKSRVTQLNPNGEIFRRVTKLIEGKGPDDFVFTRADGKQVRDFRGAWDNLVAGLKTGSGKAGKVTIHDLRRSAVTRTQTLGIPQSLAKEVSGHLTDEVFSRYVVTDDSIRQEIARKIESHKGTNMYTRSKAIKQGV
jgi:integrase